MSVEQRPEQKEWSRQDFLDHIASAQDLGAVFDLANTALSRRGEWGDSLQATAASAQKWASLCFPAYCAPDGTDIKGILHTRETYLAIGLASAKATAAALLAPFPPIEDAKTAELEWSAFARGSEITAYEACASVLKAASPNGRAPMMTIFDYLGLEGTYRQEAKSWEQAAHVKSFEQVAKMLAQPEADEFKADGSSVYKKADRAKWDGLGPCEGAPERLLSSVGIGYLNTGPAGGLERARKSCQLLLEAYSELSASSGLALEDVALDLTGLQLNMRLSGAAAFHNPRAKSMGFGHIAGHFGHEWTHLLDAAIQNHGDAEQKKALAELKAATRAIPPDPELLTRYVDAQRAEETQNIGYFLLDKGLAEARAEHLRGTESDPQASPEFMALCVKACEGGLAQFITLLEAERDPSSAEIKPDGAKHCYDAIRLAYDIDPDPLRAESEFMRQAILNDKMGYAKTGYFVSEKEMIARASESYWHSRTKGKAPALIGDGKDERIPTGSEAEFMSRSYEQLMDRLKANPRSIPSAARERLSSQPLSSQAKQEESQMAELAASIGPARLSGWREARVRSDVAKELGAKGHGML